MYSSLSSRSWDEFHLQAPRVWLTFGKPVKYTSKLLSKLSVQSLSRASLDPQSRRQRSNRWKINFRIVWERNYTRERERSGNWIPVSQSVNHVFACFPFPSRPSSPLSSFSSAERVSEIFDSLERSNRVNRRWNPDVLIMRSRWQSGRWV